jgi:methylenetetrahydrofolate--tRNA-(uracil-5-)-methyltransferase
MNVNFGLFPPLSRAPTRDDAGNRLRGTARTLAKKRALCRRALVDLGDWMNDAHLGAAAE